jgi:hypothetical protein
MNQNLSVEWSKAYSIAFRFFFAYLTVYFLFMEDFLLSKFPWLNFLHNPFASISTSLLNFISSNFKWVNSVAYVDISCFLTIAVLVAIVWTFLDKRKNYTTLFKYSHAAARYYLAFVLLSYGLAKITWLQMPQPWPSWLVEPLGNLRPFILFWNFMGTSKSYQFFAGLTELIPGVLLLFSKTSLLGALIVIGVLVNVLMLNIGYEVFVIPFIIELILIAVFIASPNLTRLYDIFVANKAEPLSVAPVVLGQNKYRWIKRVLKLSLITYVMIVFIMEVNEVGAQRFGNRTFYSLHGIYKVKDYYHNQQSLPPLTTDSIRWDKLIIDGIGGAKILYMNESSEYYDNIKVDTIGRIFEFYNDSTAKNKMHYTLTKLDQYVFEGTYKNDSIHFIAEKVDLKNLPLFKNRNIVRWTW